MQFRPQPREAAPGGKPSVCFLPSASLAQGTQALLQTGSIGLLLSCSGAFCCLANLCVDPALAYIVSIPAVMVYPDDFCLQEAAGPVGRTVTSNMQNPMIVKDVWRDDERGDQHAHGSTPPFSHRCLSLSGEQPRAGSGGVNALSLSGIGWTNANGFRKA